MTQNEWMNMIYIHFYKKLFNVDLDTRLLQFFGGNPGTDCYNTVILPSFLSTWRFLSTKLCRYFVEARLKTICWIELIFLKTISWLLSFLYFLRSFQLLPFQCEYLHNLIFINGFVFLIPVVLVCSFYLLLLILYIFAALEIFRF